MVKKTVMKHVDAFTMGVGKTISAIEKTTAPINKNLKVKRIKWKWW